jgi:hypothetical protein
MAKMNFIVCRFIKSKSRHTLRENNTVINPDNDVGICAPCKRNLYSFNSCEG